MTDYRLELVETFKVGDILFSKDRFFGAEGPFDEAFPRQIQRFFYATEEDVENYSGKGLHYYKLIVDEWGTEDANP